jgi:hypothetical protein
MSYVKRSNHSIVVLTHPGGSTNTLRFGVRGWSGGCWLRAESVIVRIKCIFLITDKGRVKMPQERDEDIPGDKRFVSLRGECVILKI